MRGSHAVRCALAVLFVASPVLAERWTEIHHDGDLTIETLEREGAPPRIRARTRLAEPPAAVRAVLLELDAFSDWVPGLSEWEVLSRDADGALVYGRHDLPWPLSDRDYVVRYTWTGRGDELRLEARSTDERRRGPEEGVVRLLEVHTVWEVAPSDAGGSVVTYTYESDLGGRVPGAALRFTWTRQATDAFAGLAEAVRSRGVARAPVDPVTRALLFDLSSDDRDAAGEALRAVTSSGDERFVAVLIELLRAQEIGIANGPDRRALVRALESLSGQELGGDWPAWVKWYAGTSLEPPEGFTGWKGSLLARIDPRFGPLLPFGAPTRIRVEEIVWGGVAFEGIPALDEPETLAAGDASFLAPDEPVFGVAWDGEARAYPLRILDWHEMANDELAGVPFSLAYCTLCGSGVAYERRLPDGRVLDFGSSGFLMRSNKLMVDRQTRSLWNHFTGRPVVGPLAEEEIRLRVLPSVVTTWGDWRARHPETRVLSLETGHDRPYLPGAAYADYFASPRTMFPVPARNDALAPKARIFGLELDGVAKAYPVERLVVEGVLNDRIGATDVVLVAAPATIEVEGRSVRSRELRHYDAGAAIRAYLGEKRSFTRGDGPDELLDEQGRAWRVTEGALRGPAGEALPRQPGVMAYWFGWSSYHPKTLVFVPAAPGSASY